MLKDLNIEWVILGHSERRNIFGESSEVHCAPCELLSYYIIQMYVQLRVIIICMCIGKSFYVLLHVYTCRK